MILSCRQCGKTFDCAPSHYNRAMHKGAPLYCSRACFQVSRRAVNPPTDAERRAAKAAYDREYRKRDPQAMKAKKAAYFQRTYDPKKAAVERKTRAPLHAEYCRRPEYKAWKSQYDRKHLARKQFGPFAEAALVLRDIETEIAERASRYEIYQTNGTLNKAQSRRRAL